MKVFCLAEYILRDLGGMTAVKLRKLVYYCQCWSLALRGRPLFRDRIEAWVNGPACPALFAAHKGIVFVDAGTFDGDPDVFDDDERGMIDEVLDHYGDKTPLWLSAQTHSEAPWINARKG